MRARAVAGLGVLLTLGLVTAAHAAPINVLEDCGKHIAPRPKGIDSLNKLCPGLEDALEELGLPINLPATWRADLTLDALRDVAGLTARYQRATNSGALDAASLKAIVAALKQEQTVQSKSWFDRLVEWLRSLLSKSDARSLSWLQRLFDKIDAASGLISIVTYALLAVVLIGAIVFIGLELRSAGLLARRRRASARAPGTPTSSLPAENTGWDLDTATLYEKPSILLHLLVAALSGRGRLSANRHLTHRELVDRATLDAEQRRQFGQLASVAEEILYGPNAPSVETVNAALREGRGLLTQVDPFVESSH